MIHLGLICVFGQGRVSISFLPVHIHPLVPVSFVEETVLSPLNGVGALTENQ